MNTNSSISSVDIKNAVLATPLTKEGRVRMGKTRQNQEALDKEFLDNCFVDADFISQDILAQDINSGKMKYALNETEDYDYFAISKEEQKRYKYFIKRRSEQAQKEQFEKDLLGTDTSDLKHRTYSTIFLIEGPAGCGKTTYANYLLQNHFVIDLCNVETATQTSTSCFNKIYDFENPHLNPITAVEMLLLTKIHERLSKKDTESDKDYIDRMHRICEFYYAQFNSKKIAIKDSSQFREFFDNLYSFCQGNINYEELSISIYDQFDRAIKESDKIMGKT